MQISLAMQIQNVRHRIDDLETYRDVRGSDVQVRHRIDDLERYDQETSPQQCVRHRIDDLEKDL